MRETSAWVDWFNELAQRIAEGDEADLEDRAAKVDWHGRSEIDKDPAVDPLRFVGAVARRSGQPGGRTSVFESVADAFSLRPLPTGAADGDWSLPRSYGLSPCFEDGTSWDVLRTAAEGSVDPKAFNAAVKLPGAGRATLTAALFLIDAREHLPLTDGYIALYGLAKAPFKPTWEQYRSRVEEAKALFPGCELYEIEMLARLLHRKAERQEELVIRPDPPWIVSTNVEENDRFRRLDCWDEFEECNWVRTGGDGSHRNRGLYPVAKARRGDIMLVRAGRSEGRGIGVVLRNDYTDGWTEGGAIHVLWLNKSKATLTSATGKTQLTRQDALGRATRNEVALFRGSDCYRPTLDLLDRLGRQPGTGTETPPTSELDPTPERGPAEPANPSPQPSGPRNILLYGPPGTGKTYATTGRALAIIDGSTPNMDTLSEEDRKRFAALRFRIPATPNAPAEGQIAMVTFHQNYAYEDFVEGIRPRIENANGTADCPSSTTGEIGYELRPGIFREICKAAKNAPGKRFVLIIDEINRGNIPKIFGELITLIEDSRRLDAKDETRVTLPYSGDEFGVPNNLYLIGTMNTADRSIQQLDTALRRRFTFVEMMPEPNHRLVRKDVDGVDCRKMLRAMNERIAVLLDREHQIGHTYLFNVRDLADLADRFQNRVFPLLQEYFYDDWRKIKAVLGGNAFVRKRKIGEGQAKNLVRDFDLVDDDAVIYERLPLDEQAWTDAGEYRQIYESPGTD